MSPSITCSSRTNLSSELRGNWRRRSVKTEPAIPWFRGGERSVEIKRNGVRLLASHPVCFKRSGRAGDAQPDSAYNYYNYNSTELSTTCSLLRIFQIVRSDRLMLYFCSI